MRVGDSQPPGMGTPSSGWTTSIGASHRTASSSLFAPVSPTGRPIRMSAEMPMPPLYNRAALASSRITTAMATFAKTTFDTAIYASFRPTYPRQLYDFIFKHHARTPGARWDTAVDLGCGTGQATVELTPFKRILGVDPSAKMVASAREAAARDTHTPAGLKRFEYVQGSAEHLPFLADGSADLVVAAQACHWFDWAKQWHEVARVLRTGGTAAFWLTRLPHDQNYSEFRLARHPGLTPLITAYAQGADPARALGAHWQQPGRAILDAHLVAVPAPTDAFSAFERVYFTVRLIDIARTAGAHYPALPAARPVIMRKSVSWADLQAYLRTWSALHTYHERFPADLQRADGDIAARLVRALQRGVAGEGEGGVGEGDADEVELEFPLALLLATKA
ncbi:hypothetical protein HWV62_9835 [Athelia sp. TMB]|nr:hypothetical protein HWV62_9835 [Athelia sp. TMB]